MNRIVFCLFLFFYSFFFVFVLYCVRLAVPHTGRRRRPPSVGTDGLQLPHALPHPRPPFVLSQKQRHCGPATTQSTGQSISGIHFDYRSWRRCVDATPLTFSNRDKRGSFTFDFDARATPVCAFATPQSQDASQVACPQNTSPHSLQHGDCGEI